MGEVLSSILTILVAFIFVVGLIFLTRYVIQYFEPYLRDKRKTTNLAILETLPLDTKRTINVIRYKDKIGVIIVGGVNDLFLGWVASDKGFACKDSKKEGEVR